MFERSCYEKLEDYLQSDCKIELNQEENEYYNALYAVVGLNRKYGKESAVIFLMKHYGIDRRKARKLYSEACNLFYLNDTVEPETYRNMMYDDLMRAAKVVQLTAKTSKDFEVYGNLIKQAYMVKQLDRPDEEKKVIENAKPIKVYSLKPQAVGLPSIDRDELAAQIESIANLKNKEKERLRRESGIEDINIEEMIDDQTREAEDRE